MLLKLVTCEVPAAERAAFEERQADFGALATARGFIAQVGGWLDEERTQAATLSLWTDVIRYQLFAEQYRRRQAPGRSYAAGSVLLARETLRVDEHDCDLRRAAAMAESVRISDCTVPRERLAQFVADQRGVWSRDSEADGFILGSVLRVQQDDPRFLVLSLWDGSDEGHRVAASTAVGRRTTIATLAPSLATSVPLRDAWRVLPA